MSKNFISNGSFQDSEGNPISNGTLVLKLTQDAALTNAQGFLCASVGINIALDANANVPSFTSVWPTDQMIPNTVLYRAWVYDSEGSLVWGMRTEQVLSSPTPYDLSNWT